MKKLIFADAEDKWIIQTPKTKNNLITATTEYHAEET